MSGSVAWNSFNCSVCPQGSEVAVEEEQLLATGFPHREWGKGICYLRNLRLECVEMYKNVRNIRHLKYYRRFSKKNNNELHQRTMLASSQSFFCCFLDTQHLQPCWLHSKLWRSPGSLGWRWQWIRAHTWEKWLVHIFNCLFKCYVDIYLNFYFSICFFFLFCSYRSMGRAWWRLEFRRLEWGCKKSLVTGVKF